MYDGVVYAVFVSLGFALWGNISNVLHFGFFTAVVRAVTAIPGHACFGVFMGMFYGLARSHANLGEDGKTLLFQTLSVFVPVLLHGTYDYVASVDIGYGEWAFFAMILVLFAISFLLVDRMSKNDRYFRTSRSNKIYIR